MLYISYDISMADEVPPEAAARMVSIRRDLARLCRSRKTRTAEFTRSQPTQWQPFRTIHPETKETFTEDGAWQFVADLLDAGQPLTEVALKKPPGKKGYVMEIPVKGWRPIYIKLQLGSGRCSAAAFIILVDGCALSGLRSQPLTQRVTGGTH